MPVPVIMPKVDMVMETGTLVEWLKKEGDHVTKGEPLFVIMTDKAAMEIEAPASGILAGIRAKPNQVVPVTEVIAYIVAPGESLPQEVPEVGRVSPAIYPLPSKKEEEAPRVPEGMPMKVRASPAARRLAAELHVDLRQVKGSGPEGRIQEEDVWTYHRTRESLQPTYGVPKTAEKPAVQIPLPEAKAKGKIPLAGPRKIIAERISYSAFTAPHIVLSVSVNMSETVRLYQSLSEAIQQRTGQRLTYTAILARAVAAVLPKHPLLNATLAGEEIILWEDVHLGIATAVDDYLIVPVIRQAQEKDLEQIVVELNDLVSRARAKRLTPSEMSGSTFTISNLGMFGIESFQAIINPPEVAILAAGKIHEVPIGQKGQVVLTPFMHLSLSADHRVVDGVAAARFLSDIQSVLENLYLLI